MMTREEILKLRPDFAELIARMPPMPPKPKPKLEPEIRAPLNGKIAEAAKANRPACKCGSVLWPKTGQQLSIALS